MGQVQPRDDHHYDEDKNADLLFGLTLFPHMSLPRSPHHIMCIYLRTKNLPSENKYRNLYLLTYE